MPIPETHVVTFIDKAVENFGGARKRPCRGHSERPREAPAKLKTRLLQVRHFHEELRLAGVKSATEGLYVLQIAGDLRLEEGQDDKDEEFG